MDYRCPVCLLDDPNPFHCTHPRCPDGGYAAQYPTERDVEIADIKGMAKLAVALSFTALIISLIGLYYAAS